MRRRCVVLLVVLLALAISSSAYAQLSGAVWTTTADGTRVDANIYDVKCPPADIYGPPLAPFLNGGPNLMAPNAWVQDWFYYFMVTEPAGKVLLSTDSIENRKFEIRTIDGKKVLIYNGTHVTGVDALTGGDTVALCPFLDTPNNGNEYKLWIIRVEDYDPGNPQAKFGFLPNLSKTDNFKVRRLASVWGEKVDQDGNPVPGLHIILYRVDKVKGVETLVRIGDTVTNVEGQFSFTGLSANKYAVDEDLAGTNSPSPGLNPLDYSSWIRVSPNGPIYFTIGKGNIGKGNTPGVPIYIGQFVNRRPNPATVKLAGMKIFETGYDEPPTEWFLEGWEILIEVKTGNGTWGPAVDADGNDVSHQTTNASGMWCVDNLPSDRVYRVSEVRPEGWEQVFPEPGGPETLITDDPPFTVYTLDGMWVVDVDYVSESGADYTYCYLDFRNDLAEISVKKQSCLGTPLSGWVFQLFEADGVTPATDAFGNPVPDAVSDVNGIARWYQLLGGDYVVVELGKPGWSPITDPVQAIHVEPGQENAVVFTFVNRAQVCGLTPGYWKNWRNHYSDSQILVLAAGTIAPTIAQIDAIFAHWDANPTDYMTILRAFLLADQLTVNLTQHPELPNPSGGSLVLESTIPSNGGTLVLGEVIAEALSINANPGAYPRYYVLVVKGWLEAFATAQCP